MLGVSGIDYLDQTIDRTVANSRSPLMRAQAKVSKKLLKEFDKQTGAFLNKDITEDFSVNKTMLFLQNNGQFQNMSVNLTNHNNMRYMDQDG